MSTRSTIFITNGKDCLHEYYHHCDGYLAGVGNELKLFVHVAKRIVSSDEEITLPGYSSKNMFSVLDWCFKTLGNGEYELQDFVYDLSFNNTIASDIEYIYLILVEKRSCQLYFLPVRRIKNSALKARNYNEIVDEVALFGIQLDTEHKTLPFTHDYESELIAEHNKNMEVEK